MMASTKPQHKGATPTPSNGTYDVSAGRHGDDLEIDEATVQQFLADADDPSQWGEVVEVGPGFYRAPEVARQLAETVAAYRAQHGLTQEQLGKLVWLQQSQIARIEAGQHTPMVETLVRFARHLNLTFTVTAGPHGAALAVAAGETPSPAPSPQTRGEVSPTT